MSCHNTVVAIIRKSNCFHDFISICLSASIYILHSYQYIYESLYKYSIYDILHTLLYVSIYIDTYIYIYIYIYIYMIHIYILHVNIYYMYIYIYILLCIHIYVYICAVRVCLSVWVCVY